jgi:hypothetical protein
MLLLVPRVYCALHFMHIKRGLPVINKFINLMLRANENAKSTKLNFCKYKKNNTQNVKKIFASSGNRTRAARVAGEHSTTEPTMLCCKGV